MILNESKRKIRIESTNVKGKVLSCSLLWMSLGLSLIILVAWLTSSFSQFRDFMEKISYGPMWSMTWIFNFILIFGLFYTLSNKNISIIIPIILYAVFGFYEGIFVSSILFYSHMENQISSLLLYMLIPAGIFMIAGLLSYFNLIDFSKILPYTLLFVLAMFVLMMVMIFTNNSTIEKWYLILAGGLFFIWIGFDLQMIQRTEESLNGTSISKNDLARMSFIFGVKLFIDFVNLLIILLNLFRD